MTLTTRFCVSGRSVMFFLAVASSVWTLTTPTPSRTRDSSHPTWPSPQASSSSSSSWSSWSSSSSVAAEAERTASSSLSSRARARGDDSAGGGEGGGRERHESPGSPIRPLKNIPMEVREGDPDGDRIMAQNFLNQYGFHRQGRPLDFLESVPSEDQQQDVLTRELLLFQSFYGLRQTGRLDGPTLRLMKKDRCGVADIPPDTDTDAEGKTSQSPSKYSLIGTKWDNNRLTWKLDTSSTRQLDASVQRRVMKDAFETWRRVTPLEFSESGGGKVDIDIKFGSGRHGDDFPFDGRGKVLAHAFGPGEGDIDGDMHLDDEEDWSSARTDDVSDLYLVATHELGHSLGLSHSRDPGALMYPYYGLTDRLGPDDIRAIQSLYGMRIDETTTRRPYRTTTTTTTPRPTRGPRTRAPYTQRPTRPQTTPTPTPTTAPPVRGGCGVQFEVVIQDPVQKHVYSGLHRGQIYRFTSGGVLPGYPTPLRRVYPGAPVRAEAVFTVPERKATYFISDNKVWRYQGSALDPSYPKDLDPTHFPEVIRFVLPIIDRSGHRRIFVFGSTYWWEYNFDSVPTGHYRPRINLIPQYWPAMASDVNYAVMGTDNYIYLISPSSHVVLDSFRRALYGGRQEGHPQWMTPACRAMLESGAASGKYVSVTWYAVIINLLLLLLLTK